MNQPVKQPFSETLWDERETWSRDRIESFQLDALKRQLERVGKRSAHYKRVFAEIGFQAGDLKSLADLRHLPFTRKSDYVAGLAAKPPFGSLAAVVPGEAVRVHFSSGTTARPAPVLWTQADIDRWADLYARYLYSQGLRRGDVFQCMFNYAWFVGGLGATLAAQHLGALVIPASSGDTERQLDTIFQYEPKCVIGTPSFMAHMAEAAERLGRDLASSTVKMVCVGGEPGASIPGTRERIERQWGAKMFDCYGALECQPIGWDTAAQLGPTLAEDFIHVEILHPDTAEPVADGERGVLVLTHLDKQACPLVRWWTGDIVVRAFPGLTSEYLLVIDDSLKDPKTGFLTGVKLRVEPAGDAGPDLAERLEKKLREKLQVRFRVEVLAPGTLPRTVHKAKRVVHE